MLEALATGSWVHAARARFTCRALLAVTCIAAILLFVTGHGTLDAMGRPIGTDFSDVYAAGWMTRHGAAADAWVWPLHYHVQQLLHADPAVPFYGWHYPPPFLLLAAMLAAFPYLTALALWQATTLAAAVLTVHRIAPGRGTILAALAAPATFVCLGHGQNAFLTAALVGGGMLLLDRRPFVAGLLLGCLVYKPQFALLVPAVTIAAWRPRAMIGAALSSGLLILATLAIWGWPVWAAFFHSLPLTRTVVIEAGGTGWEKIVSLFAAARALGAPLRVAYALQGVATAAALLLAALAARFGGPMLRGALAATAALLSTPYVLDYDLTLAGIAIAFLVADSRRRGWLSYERSLLAIAYLAPLVGRQIAAATLLPVDWLAVLSITIVAARRLWRFDLAVRAVSVYPSGHARAA